MKRTKTHAPVHDEIRRLEAQLQALPRPQGTFGYSLRAQTAELTRQWFHAVVRAHRTYHQDDAAHTIIEQARARYGAALEAAYPPGFWDSYERLRAGDAGGLENTVPFLEADPMFYRSGYVKQKIMRAIKPAMLAPEWVERLGRVVLGIVDTRSDRDFRVYCQLACKVDTPALRDALAQRMENGGGDVRHRARWVLEALQQPR